MSGTEKGHTDTRCSAGIIVIGDEILKGHVVDVNSQFLCKELWNLGIDVQKVSVVGDSVSAIEDEVRHFSRTFRHVLTCGGIGPTHDDVTLQAIAKAFDEELCENADLMALFSSDKLESCRKMAMVPASTRLLFARQPSMATRAEVSAEDPESAVPLNNHRHHPNSGVVDSGSGSDNGSAVVDDEEQAPVTAGDDDDGDDDDASPLAYPVLMIHDVFVLPGVPLFLREGFRAIKGVLRETTSTDCQFHMFEVRVRREEVDLAGMLSTVQNNIQPAVQLGSYPQFQEDGSQRCVVLRLESAEQDQLTKARKLLLRRLSETSILETSVRRSGRATSVSESSDTSSPTVIREHERVALATFDNVSVDKVLHLAGAPQASHFSKVIANALCIIEDALARYGPGGLCLCFNGGKDCTVLMHLLSIVRHRQFNQQQSAASSPLASETCEPIVALYIRECDPFQQVEDFIQESVERYGLRLLTVEGSYKDALAWLIKTDPSIKGVLMGTRRTDPHASDLVPFVMTDGDWPQVMRVNPILDFTYSDIWRFLRDLNVPYCSLYDEGYTSLGGRSTTVPNPALHSTSSSSSSSHLPAYLLSDGDRERDGRMKSKTPR